MRIDEDKDKQSLREAIVAEFRKPPRLRQEADRHTDSLLSGEAQAIISFDGIARNTQLPRN